MRILSLLAMTLLLSGAAAACAPDTTAEKGPEAPTQEPAETAAAPDDTGGGDPGEATEGPAGAQDPGAAAEALPEVRYYVISDT